MSILPKGLSLLWLLDKALKSFRITHFHSHHLFRIKPARLCKRLFKSSFVDGSLKSPLLSTDWITSDRFETIPFRISGCWDDGDTAGATGLASTSFLYSKYFSIIVKYLSIMELFCSWDSLNVSFKMTAAHLTAEIRNMVFTKILSWHDRSLSDWSWHLNHN